MLNIHLNILAILVSAIAAFVIGALWYSPILFGKIWMKAHAFSPEKAEELKKSATRAFMVSFLCFLVMAVVMAALVHSIGIVRVLGGAKLGVLCWAGFAATNGLTAKMFSGKAFSIFLIDAAYQLVSLVLMGCILAAWK